MIDAAGSASDPFHLERFISAQAPVYETVLHELETGRKRTHWMWFIFPQHRDLGRSATAEFYGIGSLPEARAYLAHSLLGPRLTACVQLLLMLEQTSLAKIFGSPDDLKFRSCMTLFSVAADSRDSIFHTAIERYCGGRDDEQTLEALGL